LAQDQLSLQKKYMYKPACIYSWVFPFFSLESQIDCLKISASFPGIFSHSEPLPFFAHLFFWSFGISLNWNLKCFYIAFAYSVKGSRSPNTRAIAQIEDVKTRIRGAKKFRFFARAHKHTWAKNTHLQKTKVNQSNWHSAFAGLWLVYQYF